MKKSEKPSRKQIEQLFHAIVDDAIEIVVDLVESSPELLNVFGVTRQTEWHTPLTHSLRYGRFKLARYLMQKGADVNLHKMETPPPIHFLVNKDSCIETLKAIVACKADVNAKNENGFSPLCRAIDLVRFHPDKRISREVLELLIKIGAKKEGRPLERALTNATHLPNWAKSLLEIDGSESSESPAINECERDEFLEHPDGTFSNCYGALKAGVETALNEHCDQWILVDFQGESKSGGLVTEPIFIKGTLVRFSFEELRKGNFLSKARCKVNLDQIENENGFCRFSKGTKPRHIAATLEAIMKFHFKLPQSSGDYAVSFALSEPES